jgi:MerR family transcriptional regulator, redox-sensitive transcriptional activator SoxR
MEFLTISQVARQTGVPASAIRYYESRKILPAPRRIGGQRRYEQASVHRLAVVRRAQQAGFSLEEIRKLFFGFRPETPASARWQALAAEKAAELDEQMARIQSMKALIERLRTGCRCDTVEDCGAAILRAGSSAPARSPARIHRSRSSPTSPAQE